MASVEGFERGDDAGCGPAVAVEGGPQLRPIHEGTVSKCSGHAAGLVSDDAVPAGLHGLGPFGLVAECDARNTGEVGLLLDAAGVGGDGVGMALESDHRKVANRIDD